MMFLDIQNGFYGQFQQGRHNCPCGQFTRGQDLHVPCSNPYDPNLDPRNSLEVPNQLPPPVTGSFQIDPSLGLMSLGDGRFVDIRNKRIVGTKQQGSSWGSRMIENPFGTCGKYWNDNGGYIRDDRQDCGNLSRQDLEYQMLRNQGEQMLANNMSDLQKELMQKFQNGELVSKSNLVEV